MIYLREKISRIVPICEIRFWLEVLENYINYIVIIVVCQSILRKWQKYPWQFELGFRI